MNLHVRLALLVCATALTLCDVFVSADEIINPFPRPVLTETTVAQWDFADLPIPWKGVNHCHVEGRDDGLYVEMFGEDPYFMTPPLEVRGPLEVRFRARVKGGGAGQVFWSSNEPPIFSEAQSQFFDLNMDNQWHEYAVPIHDEGPIARLRFDPGHGEGQMQIESMRLVYQPLHPLEIRDVTVEGDAVRAWVINHGPRPVTFRFQGTTTTLEAGLGGGGVRFDIQDQPEVAAAGSSVTLTRRALGNRPFEAVAFRLVPEGGLPPVERAAYLYHPRAPGDWLTLEAHGVRVQATRDGVGARVLRNGRLVALLCPLALREGRLPRLSGSARGNTIAFQGERGERVDLVLGESEMRVHITADVEMEGPVVRAVGALEQGLFPGVEYLGRGESSSSKLDIVTSEHIRYAPDRMWVTLPMMGFVTDRASVAMMWFDMDLQPVFATPNFFDGVGDHRMSLRGKRIMADLRLGPSFSEGDRLEHAILWTIRRRELLNPPPPPRSSEAQFELCLTALQEALWTDGQGWGHCIGWPTHFYADHASTVWELTGEAPDLPRLDLGGSHIENNAAYLVTGRARQWLELTRRRARALMDEQDSDGAFRYTGRYREGHFEDTASGYCGQKAMRLMEHALYAGCEDSLAAGLKTLEYARRFRTPRGAQVWEMPLHTPDILASAYLTRAYTLAFQMTGDTKWRREAVRWAISGLPFVYHWSSREIMHYATIAVLGATNWEAPNWMGLPVQWCGTVYAEALLTLAPLDQTVEWQTVAAGILAAAEQMQYPDGPKAGTLPDGFRLKTQERVPADINPCALVHLRRRLMGLPSGLQVAWDGDQRIVAPYPVTLVNGQAIVQAPEGARYQVVINGEKIMDIDSSTGRDTIVLEVVETSVETD